MKMDFKITLMNTLITSGMMATAIVAVVLITKVIMERSNNKKRN